MKISTAWLQKYLALNISSEELSNVFTSIGLEVEGTETIGVAMQETLVVGEIREVIQHPNADKLSVCQVCVGENDIRQIVCGAKNFRLHDHVPVALAGTMLPGDLKISKGVLRGIESNGMMCSGRELGLGNDHSGLLILDQATKVGTCLHDAIAINNDTIFDISLTANRGDCLSHIGIARDVAAKLNIELQLPKFQKIEISEQRPNDHFLEKISIQTSNCECYTAICIKGVHVTESPEWTKRDLAAVGIRSVNNIVDIGNWAMIETGQPVHIFDAKKINGNALTIRHAHDGEKLISLDGKERVLSSDMMVICDAKQPLVIAGITGSIAAEIDSNTTDILIESAYFNPDNIRKTARKLNISTESSYRFARDIDTANIANYGIRVANIINKISGGQIVSKCWKIGTPNRQKASIDFEISEIKKLCGFDIPRNFAQNALERLGFKLENFGSDTWKITVPAHRPDISCSADIVSECLRMYGTDKIATVPAKSTGVHRDNDKSANFVQNASDYFSKLGFFECKNISLRSNSEAENLFGKNSAINIRNPLNSDQNCYRNSLIVGLLENLRFNIQNGNFDTKFFEIGHVALKINGKFNECLAISCIVTENPLERSWKNFEATDFHKIKGMILPILKNYSQRVPSFETINESNLWQHGHSASCGFLHREKFQANCGLLNVALTKKFDIKQHIFAAEIIIHPEIFNRKGEKTSYKPYGQFPRISKDLSLIVKDNEAAANVESNVLKAAKRTVAKDVSIESTNIFDVYKGNEIPEHTKNIGITINYRSDTRTLTDEEVISYFNAALSEIKKFYEIRKQA